LSCLVLYTPLAGRMLRAGGRDGPPPPPQYMPRRALASPRVGARITRVRFSTKSNYLSHIRSSHIRLQSSVDHCQTGVASESLSTAVASLPGSHFLSHLSLPLTYNPPIHSLSSAKPGPYRLPHPTTQFGVRLLQIALIPPVPCFHWRLSALAATKGGDRRPLIADKSRESELVQGPPNLVCCFGRAPKYNRGCFCGLR